MLIVTGNALPGVVPAAETTWRARSASWLPPDCVRLGDNRDLAYSQCGIISISGFEVV